MDDKLTTENLYNVLRVFMKNLVDADEITFLNSSEIYWSGDGTFLDIQLTAEQV